MKALLSGDGHSDYLEVALADWDNASSYALARHLSHYLDVSRLAFAGPLQYLSLSVDKSRVHSVGLQNCALFLPHNTAVWAAPQVVREIMRMSMCMWGRGFVRAEAL